MGSEYDDSIWELVPDHGREPDRATAALAESFAAGAGAVLDLGCGDGLYLAALAASGAEVHAADRSRLALQRAGRRAPRATLHEVADDERLPLADNSVDRVWCWDALEHVVDTQTVLSEARRVLVPGGELLVGTPDHPLLLRLRLALGGWDEHFDPFSPHLRFYTARSLAAALTGCGFEPPSIGRRGGVLVARALRV